MISSSIAEIASLGLIFPYLSYLQDENNELTILKYLNIENSQNILFSITIFLISIILIAGFLRVLNLYFNYRLSAFIGSDISCRFFNKVINQEYIEHCAQKLNLSSQVHFLGFVDNEELPYLYKQSLALVMPTYFGPTNLPPEEASILECPILYSDLPDLKEQVIGRALLMDLKDPYDMARKLKKVINNDPEVKELVLQAKNDSNEKKERYLEIQYEMFKDYNHKRSCWDKS